MLKNKVLFIAIFILIFSVSMEGKSEEWTIIEKYSVTDFDKEGNNIYLGEDECFYIDKIDMSKKELIIERFNIQKKLIDVIKTGIIYERTEKNQYFRSNSQIAIFFYNQYMYLYYPGKKGGKSFEEIWKIDLLSKNKEKLVNLKDIELDSVFGYEKSPVTWDPVMDKRYLYESKQTLEKQKKQLE